MNISGPDRQSDQSRQQYDKLKQAVQDELRDYGQYLAMRDAVAGEQRFGIPEIVVAVMVIITWGIGTYVKAYLAELGKLHAGGRKDVESLYDVGIRLDEIVQKLHTLRSELHTVRSELDNADAIVGQVLNELNEGRAPLEFRLSIDRDGLVEELQRLGLTRRAARDLSPRLALVLEDNVNNAIEEARHANE